MVRRRGNHDLHLPVTVQIAAIQQQCSVHPLRDEVRVPQRLARATGDGDDDRPPVSKDAFVGRQQQIGRTVAIQIVQRFQQIVPRVALNSGNPGEDAQFLRINERTGRVC
jgi:hypothetical protein